MNALGSINAAIAHASEEGDSASRASATLSPLQRAFALHFVQQGGKAQRAAILAGYGLKGSSVAAARCLANRKVLAEIKRLTMVHVDAALPVAIRTYIDVCMNSKDDRARVLAADKLTILAGVVPKNAGPTVAVQVNVNGQQAQALIREVWDARQRRESDIGGGMSDISGPDTIDLLAAPTPAIDGLAGDGRGGDQAQGPMAVDVPIPPHSSERLVDAAGAGLELAEIIAGGLFDAEDAGAAVGAPEIATEARAGSAASGDEGAGAEADPRRSGG